MGLSSPLWRRNRVVESGRIATRAVVAERIERRMTREYTIVYVYEGMICPMGQFEVVQCTGRSRDLARLLTHSTDVTKTADPDIAFFISPGRSLIRSVDSLTILTSLLLQISFLFSSIF